MPDKHPYVQAPGVLTQILNQLRKSLPQKLDATALQKLGLGRGNEGTHLSTLRFLRLIDDAGLPTQLANDIFVLHDDNEFAGAFAKSVKDAYKELFTLHRDEAWTLDRSQLMTFFRKNDKTSDNVGGFQAYTFQALAVYVKKAPASTSKPKAKPTAKSAPKTSKIQKSASLPIETKEAPSVEPPESPSRDKNIGLTVRIEINLPLAPDQDTYDRIFKSIRENLLEPK